MNFNEFFVYVKGQKVKFQVPNPKLQIQNYYLNTGLNLKNARKWKIFVVRIARRSLIYRDFNV